MSSLPPIFPLKIHWLPSDIWMLVSRFCLKTFVLLSKSWAIPEVEAFLKKSSWNRTPILQTPQIVDTAPRSSGVAGIIGQESGRSLMVLLFCSSGGPHPLVTPWHRICPRVSSQTKSPLTCSDFDFSPNSPDHHTYQHTMLRTDTETIWRQPDIV